MAAVSLRDTGRQVVILVAVCFTLEFPVTGAPQQPSSVGDKEKRQRIAAEGYLGNRSSFPNLSCRFQLRIGLAQSLAQATKGELVDSVSADVRWAVRKDRVLYERICDPRIFEQAQEQARKTGSSSFSVPINSTGLLTGSGMALGYSPGLQSVNLIREGRPQPPIDLTPFGMELMGRDDAANPGRLLLECIAGKRRCREITAEKLDGRDVIFVAVAENVGESEIRFWLDPERGYNPLRFSMYAKGSAEEFRAVWSEFKGCSDGRWFPAVATLIFKPGSSGPYRVKALKLTDLQVEQPPADNEMCLRLPKGTCISDPETPFAHFTLSEDRLISSADLPQLLNRAMEARDKRVEERKSVVRADGSRVFETSAATRWPTGLLTAAAVGLVFAVALAGWVRRKRLLGSAPPSDL